MPQPTAVRILETLIDRKVNVHYIYTGSRLGTFNHRGQLQKMFPELQFGDRVSLTHLPHVEHTQMFEQDRREVLDAVTNWVTTCCATIGSMYRQP